MTADFFVQQGGTLSANARQIQPLRSGNHRGEVVTYGPRIVIASAGDIPVPVPEANGIPEHQPVIDLIPRAGLPSNLVPNLNACQIYTTALGAGVTVDIGIAEDPHLGITGKEAAIRADLDLSAAANFLMFLPNSAATVGRPLWSLIGLEKDPRANLCLIMTFKGAVAPDAGTIAFEILGTQ